MVDCIWWAMGVCTGKCKCSQYLSMNTDEGFEISEKWSDKVDEVLQPIMLEFALQNGFKINWEVK